MLGCFPPQLHIQVLQALPEAGSASELPGRAGSPKNAKGFGSKEAIRIQQKMNPEGSCSELPQHGMGHR